MDKKPRFRWKKAIAVDGMRLALPSSGSVLFLEAQVTFKRLQYSLYRAENFVGSKSSKQE